jgi:hypothetical protein
VDDFSSCSKSFIFSLCVAFSIIFYFVYYSFTFAACSRPNKSLCLWEYPLVDESMQKLDYLYTIHIDSRLHPLVRFYHFEIRQPLEPLFKGAHALLQRVTESKELASVRDLFTTHISPTILEFIEVVGFEWHQGAEFFLDEIIPYYNQILQ